MKNKIFLITALLAGLFMFSSCLKDDHDYWADEVDGKMYATVFSPGFHSKSIQPVATPDTFSFMINIATDELPTSNTTVNLAFDNAAITAYVETLRLKAIANKDTLPDGSPKYKHYVPFPDAELIDQSIVIPKGARTGTVRFRIWNADLVDLSGDFMLGVTITSVTPTKIKLTGNMSTYLLAMPVANAYEGKYANDGYFKHPTAASSRALTADKELLTVDASTCKLGLADLADPATGQYYITVKVEAATIVVGGKTVNKVTITNVNPAGPTTLVQLDLSDDLITFDTNVTFNYYDPSTKTFILRYHYNNGAAWREIEERLTKL